MLFSEKGDFLKQKNQFLLAVWRTAVSLATWAVGFLECSLLGVRGHAVLQWSDVYTNVFTRINTNTHSATCPVKQVRQLTDLTVITL